MNILLLGSTSRTGKIFADLAIKNKHKVTAIIRDKSRGGISGVNYIQGSPADESLLTESLKGMDAVVVSLNVNRTSDNPFAKVTSPLTIISDSVKAALSAMEKNNVKRIISISASGVGDSWNHMPLAARLLIRYSNIMRAYEDHERQENLIRSSNLEWTIARPVMLTNKTSEEYKTSSGKPTGGSISRAGVAKFILNALETGNYKKEVITLFN